MAGETLAGRIHIIEVAAFKRKNRSVPGRALPEGAEVAAPQHLAAVPPATPWQTPDDLA